MAYKVGVTRRTPSVTEDELKAEAVRIASSPCLHMETCVKWSDDAGRTWAGRCVEPDDAAFAAAGGMRPSANTLQRRIEAALAWCRKNNRPARIIVLKGRRSGCSLICAKVMDLECRIQKTKALAMADVFKRSDEIFAMATTFAQSDVLPWTAKDWSSASVPGEGVMPTARSLKYPNGSVAIKETALDPNAGRGGGYRVLWFSEAAHFPTDGVRDAKRLMLATLNTVPKIAGTIVIAESTANGRAGWFYERWLMAKWPEYDDYWKKWESDAGVDDPEEAWLRVFAAWFEIPRNALPMEHEGEAAAIMARLSNAERAGVERYGWTAEQVKWRRFTVKNDFNGDEAMFDQEYPSDPESAFVLTGKPAFNRDSLRALREMAGRADWQHGELEAVGAGIEEVLAGRNMRDYPVMFRRTAPEQAWCKVVEAPRDGCRYLVTVDVASMAEIAKNTGKLDATSVLVLRAGYTQEETDGRQVKHRPRLVARLLPEIMRAHPVPDVTFYMLALLSRWYGNPPVVIEKEKGEWLILGAKRAGLNLYRERTFDRVKDIVRDTLGFSTNTESRHTTVTTLQGLVHGDELDGVWTPGIEVECPHVLNELETFVLAANGNYEAASGKHDDDVMALGIGVLCLPGAAVYRVPKRRRG